MDKENQQSQLQALEQRNRELEILNSITHGLSQEVELNRALDLALEQVVRLLDLKTGWIWLWENENEHPYLGAIYNLPPVLKDNPHWMNGTCYCLDTYQKGDLNKAANINEITCSRLKHKTEGTEGLRYHASVPFFSYGRKIGLLNVASTDWQKLSGDQLRLLYTIGDILSISIERARLFADSRKAGIIEERNRLARELHDTLAQGLSAISLKLEASEALLEAGKSGEKVNNFIHQSLNLARFHLKEVRNSVFDLRATPLESEDLPGALTLLVEEFEVDHGQKISFQIDPNYRSLAIRIEMGLYRIAKEALSNAISHSDSQEISLTLNCAGNGIQLEIKDSGKGFDLKNIPEDRFGLIGMQERAKLMNGQFDIQTAKGRGTIIRVLIPVENE